LNWKHQNKIKDPQKQQQRFEFLKEKKSSNTVARKGRILESWRPPPKVQEILFIRFHK
jgi:hypothetical protein